ncbi:hypothetical protein AB1Y20_008962 [Prymnesium parvum]|uniref:Uncharacterized protein n=1 Tax=Prymnesium parvum TaxID=97485 RepID=A0AB34K490_PRYPA
MDLMQKLFLSCGPSAPMPEETGHEKIEALPPMAEVVTASARKLFSRWDDPDAPGPAEKLFVSWAQPSWATA